MREPYASRGTRAARSRRQHDEAGAVHRRRQGTESARLARRDPRGRRRRDRRGARRRTKRRTPEQSIAGRRWTIEHGFIRQAGSVSADEGARPRRSPRRTTVSRRAEPGELLGAARAALDDADAYLSRCGIRRRRRDRRAVVPYPPLWVIYHFVTRDTISGGVLGADQKISRQEALRMATINNA